MQRDSTTRVKWLARIFFLWACCIVGRLIQLQVFQHEDYKQLALQQQERVIEISAPRGALLDRTGERLAMSVPCDSVCVNPMRIPDLSLAADILSRILQLDYLRLYGQLKLRADDHQGFMWVKRKVTQEEADRLRALKLDWIEFRTESKRVYAYGGLAAHLLGGVDFEEKGNSGIEQALDEQLTGRSGAMRVTTDVKQHGWQSKLDLEPAPGKTLRLTVLARLQYIAEQELKKAVETHHCKTGSLVVMDPKTGEILAIANYPAYDPNLRPTHGSDVAAREDLAVTAPFEPGSVFKVITIATALETTHLRPESVVSCGNGSITLFGRTIHDHNSYSSLSVEDVLAHSSNIGAINIGLKVGETNFYTYLKRFGFGKRTGIPLPGESGGMLRPLKAWGKSSIGSVAMGHEISVTSVQLALACSAIANGGYLVKPKLVLGAVTDPPVRILKPETAITMRHMMEGVVIKPYGTGFKYARIPGYSSGGKTGTAQIYDFKAHAYTHLYNASFMGFAPVNDPAVVVVVTVNGTSGTAGYGGPVSGPPFREVAAAALRLLDVPKDLADEPLPQIAASKADENDVALTDLVSDAPQPLVQAEALDQRVFLPASISGPRVPNFLGKTKREVVEQSAEDGVPIDFDGVGIARTQYPPPNSPLSLGQHVLVKLAR